MKKFFINCLSSINTIGKLSNADIEIKGHFLNKDFSFNPVQTNYILIINKLITIFFKIIE